MDIALLLIRIVLGLTIIGHGTQKLFGWFGGNGLFNTAKFFESLGIKPGIFMVYLATLSEMIGGLFFVLGFLTPLAAILIAGTMVVAIITVTGKNGYWITANGAEYNILIITICIAMIISGPGIYAFDYFIF
ncbi:putative oxidoreductase [Virgibacillus halotolerans]|uniref:DoxX family protein n=1 Tax=Virgibacillus halotolerans TaxID=1071053 RepID=UPI001960A520|nr:DoxX family protein [Virgibacillus halotolerans]MBM7599539.1 putative oxidoreductase [Virgibacillus halotolerans]